jgi:hypothetical protein
MASMSARTRLWAVMLSLALLTVQVAYVVPARASAELRATRCCATHCHHPRSTGGAARCCRIQEPPAEIATLTPAKSRHTPESRGVVLALPDSGRAPHGQALALIVGAEATPRAAPVFLLTRALRL